MGDTKLVHYQKKQLSNPETPVWIPDIKSAFLSAVSAISAVDDNAGRSGKFMGQRRIGR